MDRRVAAKQTSIMSNQNRIAPRIYDEEFKRRAVEMVLEGRGPMEVSRDLGIPRSCLTRWKKAYLERMDAQAPLEAARPSELAAENQRLRRELAYVSEQRDILKKTIAIFGEEQSRARRP